MKWTRTLDDQDISTTVNALNRQMPSQPLNMPNNSRLLPQSTSLSFTSLWQLPAKLAVFTGRKQPLTELSDLFLHSSNRLLIQQAPQITGTGGIGKTQLAIQFAHHMLEAGHIKTVIWLNADTSGVDQINTEFLRLARAFGIDTKALDQAGIVRCVYQFLNQQPKVLVVFDSATNYADVCKYCPPDNSPIRLLVTTRDDQRWAESFSPCPLTIFSLEEALEYISKALSDRKVSSEDAEKLAVCLGRFPLALAQAISYILTRNIDINSYIELYESKKTTQKKLLDTRPLSEDPHRETLWIAVNISLERIEDLNTQDIIAALSYVAPEMPILGDFIETWTQETVQNQQAIRAMRQYGIISTDRATRSIRIHQMVQEVIRLNHDQSIMQNTLDILSSKLFSYLSQSTDPLEQENRLFVMMAHALKVISILAFHSSFDNLGLMLKLACLGLRVVQAKRKLGQYEQALKLGFLALELLDAVPEFDQGHTASLLDEIGMCYLATGKVKEALPYFIRSQQIRDTKYPGDELISAAAKINVGSCYFLMGEVQKAHRLLSSIFEKLDGIPNLPVPGLLISLSATFRDLGDSDKAINLLKRALETQQQIYGDNHPEVALTLNNLCAIYAELDQAMLAIPLIEKSLEITEARFGKDHILVATTLDAMGNVYAGAGRPQDAKNILQRALNIRVQKLGAHHPLVANTKFNLSAAILDLAETDAAVVLLNETLLIQQQYYGGYCPEAGRTLHILGNAYHEQGSLDKAIESMNLAIKILAQNYGEEHRELAKVYNDISCVYRELDSFSLARESGEKALRIFQKTLGPDHVEVARTLNNLANVLREENQSGKALDLMQRALSIFEKQLGPNHLELAHPLINLGALYLNFEKDHKAKECFERALNLSIAGFQTTAHPEVALIQLQLARTEMILGCYEPAYEHGAAAYQFYSRSFGLNHTDTQDAYQIKTAALQHLQSHRSRQLQADSLDNILRSDDPLDSSTYVKLVERCLRINQPILGLQFSSMFASNNDHPELKKLTVRCYLEMGEIASAMNSINPTQEKDLANLIKQAEQQRKDSLEKIKAYDSNNQITDRITIQKALLYMQLYQFDNAKALLQTVIEKTPASEHIGPALYQLARCQYHQQDYIKALESLKRSQKIHDNDQVRDFIAKTITAQKDVAQLMQIAERSFITATIN